VCNEHVTYTVLLFHDLRIRSELGAQSLADGFYTQWTGVCGKPCGPNAASV